jgi:hypothetical protein
VATIGQLTRRVVVASSGGWRRPSTRDRLGPLAQRGEWPVEVISATARPSQERVQAIVEAGSEESALVLRRVMPTRKELQRIRKAYERLVFDFDDAIYSVPPVVGGSRAFEAGKALVRVAVRGYPRASSRRRPLIKTLREVDVCVVGNSILRAFAERYCGTVVEIPTTVSPVVDGGQRRASDTLVWVGVADNLQYLGLIADALAVLRERRSFRLIVVSSRPWEKAPMPVEFVQWSPEAERNVLLKSAIGLAPLTDDPWTRGKCVRRAILYGGHGVPAVASPIGVTHQMVIHGQTGFLATTTDEWIKSIDALLTDPPSARRMGDQAHELVRAKFSDELAASAWQQVLSQNLT